MGTIQNTIAERNIQRVSLDLQDKGYTVYRVEGVPSAPALVLRGYGRYFSVAVKTGRLRKDGSAFCPHKILYDYDELALVVGDKIVW